MLAVRLSKIVLVAVAGLFSLIVGYNNIVDYGINYLFVQHVLSMDTVFPDNAVRLSRALTDPRVHQIAYWMIIAAELAIGVVCLAGAGRLLASLTGPTSSFNAAKQTAILGLAAGVAFWFLAFLVVGGEWFQMWQSQVWNGQEPAFRFVGTIGLVLIFLCFED